MEKEKNIVNPESFCKRCQLDTVSHDQKEGYMKCRKCHMIQDFHFISQENEVRNYEDDKENAKNPRVEQQFNHPIFKTEDVVGGESQKQKSKTQKSYEEVEKKIKFVLRAVPKNISNDVFRIWNNLVKTVLDERQQIIQENKSSKEQRSVPQYGEEALLVDATIAMIQGMESETAQSERLAKKLISKMGVSGESVYRRIGQLQRKGLVESKTQKAIDVAKEFSEIMRMTDDEKEAVIKLAQNIEQREIQEGQQPQTVAGVIIYLICKNSIREQLNTMNWKDISNISAKAETTLKKWYEKAVHDIEDQILPRWTGRK